MSQLGAFSEVGQLREVLVHRPDLSLQRLTPDNCKALLFDDVLWVKKARQEHDVFVDALRQRGVSVLDAGRMLGEVLADPLARTWLLDRRVSEASVGQDLVGEMRGWLNEMPAVDLGRHLIGGIARAELPFQPTGLAGRTMAPEDFVLPTPRCSRGDGSETFDERCGGKVPPRRVRARHRSDHFCLRLITPSQPRGGSA